MANLSTAFIPSRSPRRGTPTIAAALVAVLLTLRPAEAQVRHETPSSSPAQAESHQPLAPSLDTCRAAASYSARFDGVSMLVMVAGKIVFEDYPNGGAAERANELASGTKSFWGVAAAAAVADGLLDLDEPVCNTITEWRSDPQKSRVTIRQLLSLTSGLDSGRIAHVPSYAEAIRAPLIHPPGTRFSYGPQPFQVFGELLRRKLRPRTEDPVAYLDRRILVPIGAHHGAWKRSADGNPHMPSGAAFTARDWARFGELVRLGGRFEGREIVPQQLLDQCFNGTEQNPMYGLTWWLNRPIAESLAAGIRPLRGATDVRRGAPGLPDDLVMAAGLGKQRLYVSRSLGLVVVRQATGLLKALLSADRTGFSDTGFLSRLLPDVNPR